MSRSIIYMSDESQKELHRLLEPKFTKAHLRKIRKMAQLLFEHVRLEEPHDE
jgi:hypothetical protein